MLLMQACFSSHTRLADPSGEGWEDVFLQLRLSPVSGLQPARAAGGREDGVAAKPTPVQPSDRGVRRAVEEREGERRAQEGGAAHTVGRSALLEGRVVQAGLLRPHRERRRCRVPLGRHGAQAVRFRGGGARRIQSSGSGFTFNLCLSLTSSPSL